jgi:hypothetical protein
VGFWFGVSILFGYWAEVRKKIHSFGEKERKMEGKERGVCVCLGGVGKGYTVRTYISTLEEERKGRKDEEDEE